MKVVDASAMIDVLTGSPRAGQLLAVFDDELFAPDLLVPEVFAFLRKAASSGALHDADLLVTALQQAPIEYLQTWPYAERMWSWRHNLSPYDASYVALAEDLGVTLVTTDLRLAKAAAEIVTIISF
ncbi:MAG: type II toxin-antitoxin system VapC family toxin [Ilumatobacteraceae bacterium]|nr:type II toxin-antitoxin system VapC family toxin [Ilumatobacteraceae bacterium]